MTVRQSAVTLHCSPWSSGGSREPHTQTGKDSGELAKEDLVCDAVWPWWVSETSVPWFHHTDSLSLQGGHEECLAPINRHGQKSHHLGLLTRSPSFLPPQCGSGSIQMPVVGPAHPSTPTPEHHLPTAGARGRAGRRPSVRLTLPGLALWAPAVRGAGGCPASRPWKEDRWRAGHFSSWAPVSGNPAG